MFVVVITMLFISIFYLHDEPVHRPYAPVVDKKHLTKCLPNNAPIST